MTASFNAAVDLLDENVAKRGDKIAIIDDAGTYTYREVAARVDRFVNLLRAKSMRREERVLLCLTDTIDFPTVFLGAIKAGVIPVAVNTLLKPADYDYMLRDSRARMLVVSEALWPSVAPILADQPALKHVIVSGANGQGHERLADLLGSQPGFAEAAATTTDDMCFWLYSSGSTGAPKGTVHVHSSARETAKFYAQDVLGMNENDLVFSAAKLFFAYGLGNALTFPFAVGASAVLMAERPTPASVARTLRQHKPTMFFGVPTLYGAMLTSPELPKREELRLRRCVSAGEALPPEIGKRWTEHSGQEILDGIGSTEMLHIFLSNRPGRVKYGTTGEPVPGYELRVLDEAGQPVKPGEMGELQISGTTSAVFYWNNRARTRTTFMGAWTRSGDKYMQDADGYYVYCGRNDDMLKVGGIYVSPFEVEAALTSHPKVQEAAVVGHPDEQQLIKPKAFVVLKPGEAASPAVAAELQAHVKSKLAPYKYPRWIEFLPDLPKTATGKIQRFKLRQN